MKHQKFLIVICILLVLINIVVIYKKKTNEPAKISPVPVLPQPIEQLPSPSPTPEPPTPQIPEKPPEEELPPFTEYKAVRAPDPSLGKVLGDIESHMPAGHIYRDSDKVTWAHETTHGINSNIRQKHSRFWGPITPQQVKYIDGKPVFHAGRINGFYCLEDRAIIIEEPRVTITQTTAFVPTSLRGMSYQLYMVQQAGSWNDTPLYIFDEYVAYSNGSACRKDLQIQNRAETVTQMFEFSTYSIALAMAIREHDKSYDDRVFKSFLKWCIDRSMKLYAGEEGAKKHWEKFRNSSDAEKMRSFCLSYFGQEWCDKILWQNMK